MAGCKLFHVLIAIAIGKDISPSWAALIFQSGIVHLEDSPDSRLNPYHNNRCFLLKLHKESYALAESVTKYS